MWCKSCQQDVPAVLVDQRGDLCCPRCGGTLSASAPPVHEASVSRPVAPAVPEPRSDRSILAETHMPLVYDDWELDEELRHVGRLLATEGDGETGGKSVRVDEPHADVPPPHQPPPATPKPGPSFQKIEALQSEGVLPLLTWIATLLGTMAIVCGGVLVSWAWLAGRPELWRIGQPIALGGVCSLVVGLVLQLDRAWQEKRASRSTAEQRTTDREPRTANPRR